METIKHETEIERDFAAIQEAYNALNKEQNGLSWAITLALCSPEYREGQVKDYDRMWEEGEYTAVREAVEEATKALQTLRARLDSCRRWKPRKE